jgi:hypothetical protein
MTPWEEEFPAVPVSNFIITASGRVHYTVGGIRPRGGQARL